jgi:hypothetical protein
MEIRAPHSPLRIWSIKSLNFGAFRMILLLFKNAWKKPGCLSRSLSAWA